MSEFTLYADHGCPFAHRVLAMLTLLGVEFTRRESPLGSKPNGLLAHSASERIPALLHDDLFLTESRVILEYLVELFDYRYGYPPGLHERTLHRHAIALVDEYLTACLYAPLEPDMILRFEECIDAFERAMTSLQQPTLFALHIAPIWLRLRWSRPDGLAVRAILGRDEFHRWLVEATQLHSVAQYSPDRDRALQDFERARNLGLLSG